jgi:hypothetical protein
MSDWLPLIAVSATLVPLVWLERWIHQHLHGIGLLLTGDQNAAVMMYAIPLFPGVVLHELSHWVMAKLLLVKTAKISLLPKRQRGGRVRLGAVEVQRTDPVRASLIGLAPLISGSLVVLLIGNQILSAGPLSEALPRGKLAEILSAWWAMARGPDMWLWLYLLFAVANAMLPSSTDRETWPTVLLFLAVLVALSYVLGFSKWLLALTPFVMEALSWLALAFAMTLAADIPFVLLIACAEWMLSRLRGQRVFYKR